METVALLILGPVVLFACMQAAILSSRRGKPTAGPVPDSLVFRYSAFMRWGSICVATGAIVGITAIAIAHPPEAPDDTIGLIIMCVVSAVLTSALVWECVRFRLVVGPDGLECRSPWQQHRFVQWEEVVKVSFDTPLGWLDIRATDRRTIRVPAQVGGLEALLEACERHLTPHQLLPALRAYLFLGRPFPEE